MDNIVAIQYYLFFMHVRGRSDVAKFENPRYRCNNNSCRYSKGNVLYIGPTVEACFFSSNSCNFILTLNFVLEFIFIFFHFVINSVAIK